MRCAAFIVVGFAFTWAWADCMIALAQPLPRSSGTQPPPRSPQGPQDSRSAEPFQSNSPEQQSSKSYILKVPRGLHAPVQARSSDGDGDRAETPRPRAKGPDLPDIRARLNNAQAQSGDVQVSLA